MILENKLGLTNQVELAKVEENSVNKSERIVRLWKINEIEVGTFKGLSEIHEFLFSDIYDFAGKSDRSILQKEIFDLHQLCI